MKNATIITTIQQLIIMQIMYIYENKILVLIVNTITSPLYCIFDFPYLNKK